jgi:hypothetical protein
MADEINRVVPVPAVPDSEMEQDINPWSVAGAKDDQGRTLAIDYDKLSRYDCKRLQISDMALG